MFKRSVVFLTAACLAASIAWTSGNPFVGKWKLVSPRTRLPDEMKVEHRDGNTYGFDLGGGVEAIVVDGTYQPGSGGSLLSVKAETPDTWVVRRKRGGKLVIDATWKLSNDADTLTDYYRQYEADGSTTSIAYVYRRIGGGSGFAADWQSIKETVNSPYLLVVKELQGDSLSIADPVKRRTKTLTLADRSEPEDGVGDAASAAGGVSSSLRRVDERTLVVTDRVNGKTAVTEEFVLSANLNVLTLTVRAASLKRPYVLVFERT